ncbi:MAG: histidine phosphatase family protein [Candidatus Limnocylindria bacterium]
MPVLDVRRHAQRSDGSGSSSAISPAGRALAERIGKAGPRYALVVSSPLVRAKETAELLGGRLDAVEPGLLPDLSLVLTDARYAALRTLGGYDELLVTDTQARTFAEEQLRTWARIVARVGEREHALAVSHGGIIELPAMALARRIRARLSGPPFAHCEGVRVTYGRGEVTRMEILRV